MTKFVPLVNEANLCAKEFGRKVTFSAKLMSIIPESFNKNPIEDLKNKKGEIFVKVNNMEEGYTYLWD